MTGVVNLKCSIGSSSLNCWARAIHTLAHIAENDIHFAFNSNSLSMSTFDSAVSVCSKCEFDKSFFQSYEVGEGDKLLCRVSSKCLLKPFKSLRFLLKCPDTCYIEFDSGSNTLVVSIPCKGGNRVRHKLNFIEELEAIQVEYDDTIPGDTVIGNPKCLLNALSYFRSPTGVSDLTVAAFKDRLVFTNSVNDMSKKEKVLTELGLNAIEFVDYVVREDSAFTIPMKEFKLFVSFVESMRASISLHFRGHNTPFFVKSVTDDGLYTATLMMATVLEDASKIVKPKRRRKKKRSAAKPSLEMSTISNVDANNILDDILYTNNEGEHPNQIEDTNHAERRSQIENPIQFEHLSQVENQNQIERLSLVENQNQIEHLSQVEDQNQIEHLSQVEDQNQIEHLSQVEDQNQHEERSQIERQSNRLEIIQQQQQLLDKCAPPSVNPSVRKEKTQKRKRLFANVQRAFDPAADGLPGYNIILLGGSDEED